MMGRQRASLHLTLPNSKEGIAETLKHMRALVEQGKSDMRVRDVANKIVYQIPGKAWLAQMRAVFNWVRNNIRYTLDTNSTEVIQGAEQTLTLRYGDCDDFCILIATLLEQLGYATCFCALSFDAPGQFSHVIVLAELEGELAPVALDATEKEPMGWFPPGATGAMLCPISPESSWAYFMADQ
jgi:transglutaminase-like putative cysteine protease